MEKNKGRQFIVVKFGGVIVGSYVAEADRIMQEEEVIGIRELLAGWERRSEQALFDSLWRLRSMDLPLETIRSTLIGGAVKGLKNHPSDRVKHLARALINGWKLGHEEIKHACCSHREPRDCGREPKKPDDQQLEAKMANTKRKLEEGCMKEGDCKNQRCVRFVEPENLPEQDRRHDQKDKLKGNEY